MISKKLLPVLKTDEPIEWLKELDSQILQDAVLNFGKTWQRFLQRSKTGSGFPKFRNRDKHNYMARSNGARKGVCPQTLKGRHVRIAKVGNVKMYEEVVIKNRPDAHLIDLTRPSGYIISRKADHWWISIRYQAPHIEPQKREGDHVGIDMGVAKWATLSDRKLYRPRFDTKKEAIEEKKRLLEVPGNVGREGTALLAGHDEDASRALKLLKPHHALLSDAAQFYIDRYLKFQSRLNVQYPF